MKICSICNKISGSGADHLHCVEKRRIEMEDAEFKQSIPERLDIAKDASLAPEVRAILGHMKRRS